MIWLNQLEDIDIEMEAELKGKRKVNFIYCYECGKSVSTGFFPLPTDTPDEGLILRALVICPECLQKRWTRVQ